MTASSAFLTPRLEGFQQSNCCSKEDATDQAAFVEDLKAMIKSGQIFIAEDAVIVLYGCNQDEMARALSEILPKATVVGAKGSSAPVDVKGKVTGDDNKQPEVGARATGGQFNIYQGGKPVGSMGPKETLPYDHAETSINKAIEHAGNK